METMQIVQVDQRFVFHRKPVLSRGQVVGSDGHIRWTSGSAHIVATRNPGTNEPTVMEAYTTLMGRVWVMVCQTQMGQGIGQVIRPQLAGWPLGPGFNIGALSVSSTSGRSSPLLGSRSRTGGRGVPYVSFGVVARAWVPHLARQPRRGAALAEQRSPKSRRCSGPVAPAEGGTFDDDAGI